MTIKEAKKILQEMQIDIKISNEQEGQDKLSAIIKEQIPSEGINLYKGEYIMCEIE